MNDGIKSPELSIVNRAAVFTLTEEVLNCVPVFIGDSCRQL